MHVEEFGHWNAQHEQENTFLRGSSCVWISPGHALSCADPQQPSQGLRCHFLDGLLWSSGGVQVNSSFSQPDGSLGKAKEGLGLWGLKLTSPPAEQGHSLLPYRSEKWAQFREKLQGREQTALVEEISVWAMQKEKLLLSSWISYTLGSAGKFFC